MKSIEMHTIKLPYDSKERKIRVYLPPNYDMDLKFPVIYMHDAQNLYDIKTSSYGAIWDVHTHLNAYYENTGKGIIVVGIDNWEGSYNRLNEYSPWVNTSIKEDALLEEVQEDVGGLGDAYLNFLVHDLKPWVDKHYKTKPQRAHTAIIGSSMGGLISLYAGYKHPNTFSKIGAFSTAVWFAKDELLKSLEQIQPKPTDKWYLDVGTNETSNGEKENFNQLYLQGNQQAYQVLRQKLHCHQLEFIIDKGGIHNEKDWSKRFYHAIHFLFQ